MALRRRLIGVLVLGLAALGVALSASAARPVRAESLCGEAQPIRVGDTVACSHSDEAPPGVDVHAQPSTAELRARPGAGPAAYAAAQDLGVPATQVATTATDPTVPCDGDGASGYRVQAMYVVEAGHTNRYADLLASFQRWAAGADDVVNRSAALTGGVRHLRYVTDPGGSGCVARVLNVTVPAGSMTSFSATIAAVQALGYSDPARKYLMWTDAASLCGIATMYPGDDASQANPNNGSYAQYARVDSGCWGFGNGSTEHSVEAHELLHTLGGVQNTAPHSTQAGHCWDESDTMCYADGGNHAMVQVCPVEREYFYDCNNDDYFSTFPDPGSYLAGHWDAANSRFLIGGGDGTGGGTPGSPTVLGATIAVNNPAVPGLPTQVSVTPSLPTGRTLASVAWKSARSDCTFATPGDLQSTVTCGATATGSTTVTAVLTDSTGATKTISSPLTFRTGTARPVTVALSAAGQDGATPSLCTGASFPVVARVIDTASGQPIKGLAVTFTKQAATATTPAAAGSGTTTISGLATLSQSALAVTNYTAKTITGTVYAAGSPVSVTATPGTCTVALTAAKNTDAIYYGDPVTVTGNLTRQVGGATVPVSGASLPMRLTTVSGTTTRVTSLGNAVTATDGSFRLVVKPTTSGALSVAVTGSAAYVATVAALGNVTVAIPDTLLSAAAAPTTVAYGNTVTVAGTLKRDAGGTVTALAGASVQIKATKDGAAPVIVGTARVGTDGSFSAAVPLRISGALAVSYAGAAGQPAASFAVDQVVAVTWSTAITASASATHVVVGGSVSFAGSLTRSYAGSTGPAAGVRVSAYFTPAGSTTVSLVGSAYTTTTGSYTLRVFPRSAGSWTVRVTGVAGYADVSSDPFVVTVG